MSEICLFNLLIAKVTWDKGQLDYYHKKMIQSDLIK